MYVTKFIMQAQTTVYDGDACGLCLPGIIRDMGDNNRVDIDDVFCLSDNDDDENKT